jgi:hypothetical protein
VHDFVASRVDSGVISLGKTRSNPYFNHQHPQPTPIPWCEQKMKMRNPAIVTSFALLCSLALGQSPNSNQLPVVDFGYQLHQAASYNVSQMSIFAKARRTLMT